MEQDKLKVKDPAMEDIVKKLFNKNSFKDNYVLNPVSKGNMYTKFRKLFIVPVVHAEEIPQGGQILNSQNRNATFMDWDIQNIITNESGWDRLKKMYTIRLGEKQELSKDLALIGTVCSQTFAIMFVLASAIGAKASKKEFIEKNRGEKFKTQFLALRKMHDATIRGGLKNGLVYGLKGLFITTGFMTISQTVAVYRNKSSPFEYALAGGCVMAMWRAYYGLRAVFAGSIIGGTSGLLIGCVAYGMMRLTNQTQQQRHFQELHEQLENQYAWGVGQIKEEMSEPSS